MSNETTTVNTAQEAGKKKKKLWLLTIPAVVLLLALLLVCCGGLTGTSPGKLKNFLQSEGSGVIEIKGDVKIDEPLVVNGDKTIKGNGRIILKGELAGEWPKGSKKASSWGAGCTILDLEDTDKMSAILNVSDGATLTIDGSAKVDGNKFGNGIHVKDGGKLIVKGKSTIENGRYANIVISEKASAIIEGGSVNNAATHGVVNKGKLDITGGTLSGAETGAVVYNTGTATQSGGTIEKAGVHNVYIAAGTFTMTGGKNDDATKDGVSIQKGAKAEITGGDVTNSVHGLCNDGDMSVGKITLDTCGIMNYKNGILNIDGTTVENAGTYSLGNNGGKVVAKKFTAKKGNSCAIYNFAGDMELIDVTTQGIREANITNGGGNMTVKGADLQKCNDKSIVVGNGVAVFEDIKIGGTKREKYGCYVYGGELYINNAEMKEIDSTAFKVDMGGIIEVKNATVKGVGDIGMRSDGGKMTLENVSIEDIKSHGIYNMNGEINVKNVTLKNIGKNAIQNRGGNTNADGLYAENIANHAAYVAIGNVKVSNSTFKTMEGNGFYLVEGENEATLKNVTIENVKKQGVNNNSKLTIDGLKVRNGQQNGIFNKDKGVVKAKNVDISGVAEHGINNYNTMTLENSKISNTGKGSNNLQNKGTLTIKDVDCSNSKNHGVYNTGTIKGSELEIKKAAKNGVYNNKGTFTVDKVTVDGAGEHGLNNAATMTVSNVVVKDTGVGKNNIQNAGTLSISNASLLASKNHGIYNKGTVSGKDVTVEDTKGNGIYNDGGKVDTIDGLTVKNPGQHGVNNAGTMVVANVDITGSGKGSNGIQNAGTLTVNKAVIKDTKNHGIYNKATISGKAITVENPTGNGIYNDGGTVNAIAGVTVKNAGDQGVNNKGTFVATNVDINGTVKNGIYNKGGTADINGIAVTGTGEHGVNNDGAMTLANADIDGSGKGSNCIQNKGELTVSGVTLKNSSNHGIYNKVTISGKNLTVNGTAKNGVFNDGGTVNLDGMAVTGAGEHGVNNDGAMTLANADIDGSGEGSNCIQNKGELVVSDVTLKNSSNHGIYNKATISGKALTVENVKNNGVYNDGGTIDTLDGLTIKEANNHGVKNVGTMIVNNTTIENVYDNMINNEGELKIHGLNILGTGKKAIYNSNYAELYKVTVEGKNIINKKNGEPQTRDQQRLVDNNAGILDLTDATIKDAYAIAIANRGKANTSVTNVVIDKAGDYGVYVEGDARVSGDGLEINGVVKGVSGAEGMPIKNAGKITMMDHLTIGEDDPAITGSGVATSGECSAAVNNVIVNDATNASYSGYDLVIKNAPNTSAIYNKGIMHVTDYETVGTKNSMYVRYHGWTTFSGKVSIVDTKEGPIRIDGFEDIYKIDENGNKIKERTDYYYNGVTLMSNTNLVIENVGGHGINNRQGHFLADKDSTITIRNVVGTGVNGINNNNAVQGKMTLGDVTIDGVYVKITKGSNGKINTNAGNGLQTNGVLELNGDLNISNIYTSPQDGATDNSNGSGLIVKNNGSITGTGSITINGNGAGTYNGEEYPKGLYNGVFVNNNTTSIDIAGDIYIDTVANQGLYVADGTASVKAGNITVKNVDNGQGIYNRHPGNTVIATGAIYVENIDNSRGIYTGGTLEADSITVKNVKGNGVDVLATTEGEGEKKVEYKGSVTVANDIVIDNAGSNGLNTNGPSAVVKAKNTTISNTGGNGVWINNSDADVTVTGTLSVTNPIKGRGVGNKGKLKVGNIVVKDLLGANGASYAAIDNEDTITATGDVTVDNITNGQGIRNKGELTVGGTTTITNITGTKNVNGIQQDGGKTSTFNNIVITNVTQSSEDQEEYGNGMSINGTLTLNGKATITNVNPQNDVSDDATASSQTDPTGATKHNGIYNKGTINGTGNIEISNVGGNGVCVNNAVFASSGISSITVSNAKKNGIYLTKNSEKFKGEFHVPTVTITGVGANGLLINGLYEINITTLTVQNANEYAASAESSYVKKDVIKTLNYKNCTLGARNSKLYKSVITNTIEME